MGSHGPHHRSGHRRGIGRSRRRRNDGSWSVAARLERFNEPVVLAILRDGPAHGYDLAESLRAWVPDEQIDLGNLYRMLRSMEDEGIVRSEWSDSAPGRAKRTYELTTEGENLLDAWVRSLRSTNTTIARFLQEYGGDKKGST
ncbi:MAG: PadR family transcriptional regulator [Actinomycetota bacterium]|nr:PadR family transcriptional regulator [Actinomycetota bacterium]